MNRSRVVEEAWWPPPPTQIDQAARMAGRLWEAKATCVAMRESTRNSCRNCVPGAECSSEVGLELDLVVLQRVLQVALRHELFSLGEHKVGSQGGLTLKVLSATQLFCSG